MRNGILLDFDGICFTSDTSDMFVDRPAGIAR
jgi:hypothetical protein